jgi:hypothetical protein
MDDFQHDLSAALEAVTEHRPAKREVKIAPAAVFDDLSAGVVRRAHAEETARSPDSSVVFAYQDTRMWVAVQAKTINQAHFAQLVIGYGADDDKPWQVSGAFRLYGPEEEVASLAADARLAFQTLLERYGLPFRAGNRKVLFLPVLTVRGEVNRPASLLDLVSEGSGDWTLHLSIRRNSDGTITLAWPYAMDRGAYKRDIRRAR